MKKHLIVIGTAVLLLVVGLSGCLDGDNQDTTQLSIALFNVEPSTINKGETANLIWNVTGATTVSIDNNIGNVGLSGTRIIYSIQNSTYVLTASNSNTSKTVTTQIIVLDTSESDDDDSVINLPPTKPTMDGASEGIKDTDYTYVIQSTDPDNDKIQYIINWGDGKVTETEFLPNGTASMQIHSWATPGRYIISVKAYDNETLSGVTQYAVLIDVWLIDDEIKGYLVDEDSDGKYDLFDSSETGEKTDVEKQDDGTYLIDSDGDGSWDYVYDTQQDLLMDYDPPEPSGILGFELPISSPVIEVGDEFFVTVYLDPDGKEVSFWKISMSFDSSRLEVLGVLEGDDIWLFDEGTTGTGTITDVQAWTMDDYPTYSTVLCRIKFKALSVGSAALDFTSQKIGGSNPEYTITVSENSNTVIIT